MGYIKQTNKKINSKRAESFYKGKGLLGHGEREREGGGQPWGLESEPSNHRQHPGPPRVLQAFLYRGGGGVEKAVSDQRVHRS